MWLLPAAAIESTWEASWKHAFEMYLDWFGGDYRNRTAPVSNPRSSRILISPLQELLR